MFVDALKVSDDNTQLEDLLIQFLDISDVVYGRFEYYQDGTWLPVVSGGLYEPLQEDGSANLRMVSYDTAPVETSLSSVT